MSLAQEEESRRFSGPASYRKPWRWTSSDSNSAAADDYFVSNAFPRVAVNPMNGRIYLVYADLPFPGSSTDRGDIFINEGVLYWFSVKRRLAEKANALLPRVLVLV